MSQSEDIATAQLQAFSAKETGLDANLIYWNAQLADVPPLLSLPTDRPRPSIQTFACGIHDFLVPDVLRERAEYLSQQEGATPFAFFLAVFQLLLARYSGLEDIVVGVVGVEQEVSEVQASSNISSDILVVRTKFAWSTSFDQLLSDVREVYAQAYQHHNISFQHLLEKLQIEQDSGYHPLVQSIFSWQSNVHPYFAHPDELVQLLLPEHQATRPDLALILRMHEQGLVGTFVYNSHLFIPQTIQHLEKHFQKLAEESVSRPQRRIAELPLLTGEERQTLLETWNATDQAYPQNASVSMLFERQVEFTPDALAVVHEDSSITYGEINRQANQLAHYLIQRGIGPEIPVGVYLERSIELIVGLLGVLKAGGAYVPIDPSSPDARIKYMLEDAGIDTVVTSVKLLANICKNLTTVVSLDGDKAILCSQDQENPVQRVSPENLCYVIYTSGSTGKPKGVSIRHRGLINLIVWHHRTYSLTSSSRATQVSGLAFDATVWELWPYLTAGASIHLPDSETHASPERLVEWINISGCTHSVITTLLAQYILAQHLLAKTTLRYLLTGGERIHRPDRQLSTFQFINHYGPTENTVVTTCTRIDLTEDTSSDPPIGRPIMNTQIYILNPFLEPVPVRVIGELYISGPGLARGYFKQPALTAERFIPNPFDLKGGSRLYRTGDLVRYNYNGEVEYIGREDRQVKIRGFRIELGEIEAILNQHSDVGQAVVILQEDDSGMKQIHAYVVLRVGVTMEAEELRHYMSTWLPAYMLPSSYCFLLALPLTSNGKVDQATLIDLEREQALAQVTMTVIPETELEQSLLYIWQKVLKRENISIYENFFDVGGYSFLLVQVHREIKNLFKQEVKILDLLTYPTIATFAAYLSKQQGVTNGAGQDTERINRRIERIKKSGEKKSVIKKIKYNTKDN